VKGGLNLKEFCVLVGDGKLKQWKVRAMEIEARIGMPTIED
jgi:hypothetical protein